MIPLHIKCVMLSARNTLRSKRDNVDVMSEVLQIQNVPSCFFAIQVMFGLQILLII